MINSISGIISRILRKKRKFKVESNNDCFCCQIESKKLELEIAKMDMLNLIGQLKPITNLSMENRSIIAQDYAYSEWARVALDVANQYYEGDYFEFGSEGLNTLCNFLVAFHLNGNDLKKPDVRFFAFDVFGAPTTDKSLNEEESKYFSAYTKTNNFYNEMLEKLQTYNLMLDRVELIQGYFKDTLNEKFRERLISEKRKVGFAFLDCNIASSYKTSLDFLVDFVHPTKSFIYLDEYYQFGVVADLFDDFCATVKEKYGLKARFIRTAGAYGALFVLIK